MLRVILEITGIEPIELKKLWGGSSVNAKAMSSKSDLCDSSTHTRNMQQV